MLFAVNQAFGLDAVTISKYPHILVTDDYGILNEHDLVDDRYGPTLGPLLYDQHNKLYGCYWKCFKTATFKSKCRYIEFNEAWRQHTGDLSLSIVDDDGIVNEYGMRHALRIKECKQGVRQWKKLIKNEDYICLHGDFTSSNVKNIDGKEQKVYGWVFNKLKTKKGCDGYFGC